MPLVALVLTAATPVTQDAANPAPVCERRCEKTYAPCPGAREAGEMMCVTVVRRCEEKCGGATEAKRAARTAKKR